MTSIRFISVAPGACLALFIARLSSAAGLSAQVQLVPASVSVASGQPLAVDIYSRNIADANTALPARVIGVDLDSCSPSLRQNPQSACSCSPRTDSEHVAYEPNPV